jgi:hypothetical protein
MHACGCVCRVVDLVPPSPDALFLDFEATAEDEEEDDVDIPTIRYVFRVL